ncbi:MAG: isocitrate lyase/phosphoenolpyruvate mutase family protein [Pseudomonadota bacterium]
MNLADSGSVFRDLHRPGNPFVLMNVWDKGSARVAASLGAKALGTTSSGHAFTIGKRDMGHVSRDEAMSHAQDIVRATPLPVSGDFENGYGDAPGDVAQTIRHAAEIGLAGCSIEDTDMTDQSAYAFDHAVERVRAGASAARGLGRDFVFVARADGIMNGVYDTEEAIRRLQAFESAGADCLYAPLPPGMDELARICASVARPVNALAAGPFASRRRAEFAAIGVARISLGGSMARVTHAALINTARHILNDGDFSDFLSGARGDEVEALLDIKEGN